MVDTKRSSPQANRNRTSTGYQPTVFCSPLILRRNAGLTGQSRDESVIWLQSDTLLLPFRCNSLHNDQTRKQKKLEFSRKSGQRRQQMFSSFCVNLLTNQPINKNTNQQMDMDTNFSFLAEVITWKHNFSCYNMIPIHFSFSGVAAICFHKIPTLPPRKIVPFFSVLHL